MANGVHGRGQGPSYKSRAASGPERSPMMQWQIWFLVAFVPTIVALMLWLKYREAERAEAIRSYTFPYGLFEQLRKQYPQLTHKDCQLVAQALRQFFLVRLRAGHRFIAMPSRVVDALWHEFILHTRSYHEFCRRAFGEYLHHTPAKALEPWEKDMNAGVRRAWWHACREEKLDPRKPSRLPLLFALDGKLKIPQGFRYLIGPRDAYPEATLALVTYEASTRFTADFTSDGIDGGTDGMGDGAGGDGDGCGGGCGD